MARPAKSPHPLEKQIEGLAAINCTWSEISAVTGIPERTARRKFGHLYKKGRETGKSSLKRKMWEHAMSGNTTMMIWLSKQMLGYTDKVEEKINADLNTDIVYKTEWGNSDANANAPAVLSSPGTVEGTPIN